MFKKIRKIRFTLTIIVMRLWLNSEQTTEDVVIKKLAMVLWVQTCLV